MIAPHELKNKVFNKSVRGYNCSEVDEYIEFILDQYTDLYRENSDLKNELNSTKTKYSELHNDEDSIRAVILKAQKLGETIIQQAKKEAKAIIEGAKEKCQDKIDEAENSIKESNNEIERLKKLSEDYRASLYNQYLEHIKFLKSMDLSFPSAADGELKEKINADIDAQTGKAKEKVDSIN